MLLYSSFHSKFLFSLFFHKDNNLENFPLYVLGNQRNFCFGRTRKNYSVSGRRVINKLNVDFVNIWWRVFSCASTFQPLLISLARIHATFKLVKDPDTFIKEMGNWLRLLFILSNYWRFNWEFICTIFSIR